MVNKSLNIIRTIICLISVFIYPTITFPQVTSSKSPYVIFTGEVKGGQFGRDSIRVEYQPNIMYNTFPTYITESTTHYIKTDKEGKFKIQLPTPNGIGEISFHMLGYQYNLKTLGSNPYNSLLQGMFPNFFVEPGDSIHFSILIYGDTRDPDYSISGKGSAKYKAIKDIDYMTRLKTTIESTQDLNKYMVNFKEVQTIQLTAQNALLKWYKPFLSISMLNLLKTEIQANIDLQLIKQLYSLNKPQNESLIKYYTPKIDLSGSPLSTRNLNAIIINKILSIKIKKKDYSPKYNLKEIYFVLKNDFSGLLRDKLISNYLLLEGWRVMEISSHEANEYDECLLDCYQTLQDNLLKTMLANKLQKVKSGAIAFNFDLPDAGGKRVTLDEFKGKIVLLDIYTTICTSCRTFAKTLKNEVFPTFKNNPNVVFIAISIEPDKQKWLKDIEEGHNTDKTHEIILHTEGHGLNHPMMKYYNTNSMPLLLLIDKEGKIVNSSFNQLIAKSTGAEIIQMINEAIDNKKDI